MKKTQLIELIKTIKRTFVSFISVTIFILLSITLFLGFSWGSKAIRLSTNEEFQKYNFHDFEIVCPYGLNDEEIEEFTNIDGIDLLEGSYKTYEMFELDNKNKSALITSITDSINQLSQLEGELPSNSNEIIVEKFWAKQNNIDIGQSLTFKQNSTQYPHALRDLLDGNIEDIISGKEDEDGIDNLLNNTFKVVGFAEAPNYLSMNPIHYGSSPKNNCPIDCLMFVNKSAFDELSFTGYSNIFLRSSELNKYQYDSEEYLNNLEKIQKNVEDKTYELTKNKFDALSKAIEPYKFFMGDNVLVELYGTVLSRQQSASLSMLDISCNAIDNLRYVLSSILYIIALLICYSVISRLVFEQSIYIGTKKALGFKNKEITKFYLLYSLIAALIGAILAIIIARFILEPFIVSSIKAVLIFSSSVYTFSLIEALIISFVSIGIVILVTFLSCHKSLKRNALSLLKKTDSQPKNYRISKLKIWNKLKLLYKTIISNFFTDHKRVGATLIGIIGAVTLLVCGFNFINNVSQSGGTHFGNLQHFDAVVYFDEENEEANKQIRSIIEEEKYDYAEVNSFIGTIAINEETFLTSIYISEDENFSKMYDLTSTNGEIGSIKDGLWIPNSLASNLNLHVGDMVELSNSVNETRQIKVNAITEYYLVIPSIFLDKGLYESIFEVEIKNNAFLVNTEGNDILALNNKLKNVEGFLTLDETKDKSLANLNQCSSSFVAMAGLFIFMAITMGLLVVLNLLITFVNSKKKELIVLMINGYSKKDAKKYIYFDTIILTIIGILIGIILGTILGIISINSVCSSSVIFPKKIDALAIIISILITVLLIVSISLYALSKIKKFKLKDIND